MTLIRQFRAIEHITLPAFFSILEPKVVILIRRRLLCTQFHSQRITQVNHWQSASTRLLGVASQCSVVAYFYRVTNDGWSDLIYAQTVGATADLGRVTRAGHGTTVVGDLERGNGDSVTAIAFATVFDTEECVTRAEGCAVFEGHGIDHLFLCVESAALNLVVAAGVRISGKNG